MVSLVSMLASTAGIARDSSGIVVASRGEVIVISNGEVKPLRQGAFIYEQDEINVSNRSFIVLQFVDSAKLTLRPDSTLVIEQYLYMGGKQDSATLSLRNGGLSLNSGAIAINNPEYFRIRTPGALLSASGPESSLNLCDGKVCDQQGLVEVRE